MAPREHANLLSIFFWIFAGLQAFMALLVAFYVAIMGVAAVMMIFDKKKGTEAGALVFGVIIGILGLLLAFGLISIYLNFMAGKRLRNEKPAGKKLILAASILSFFSFLCGGLLIFPFGIALGIYGLWFTNSNVGYAYFNNLALNPPQNHLYPPTPPNW